MIQLPPIPDWDQLHPLVIHFPSALLLVTPVFVILGAILSPPQGRSFLTSALIMMTAGTITLFVALETGDAAGGLVVQTAQIKQALEQHERSAETTCLLFSALTCFCQSDLAHFDTFIWPTVSL